MDLLSQRARKILAAIVQEYLATGEAVGSLAVTRRHVIDLSPASVRNVMAELEEAGLLRQPHTSAGRVPTEEGLRFFVQSLLKVRPPGPRERDELRARYQLAADESADEAGGGPAGWIEGRLREAGKVLADLSQHTVVLRLPTVNHELIEHIEFVRLATGSMLAILVTQQGRAQNRVFSLERPIAADELERIHRYLDEHLAGLTLAQARRRVAEELAGERVLYDQLAQRALELSRAALEYDEGAAVIIEGQANLLGRKLASDEEVAKMKQLFRALEDKQALLALLEKTEQAQGLQVFIGAETHLADCSLVASAYGSDDRALGTLGIIGPTRMNYTRIIRLVDFTAHLVSDLVSSRE